MVYIQGEEMTRYCMQLILDQWIHPHVDTSAWEVYDLGCKARDETDDQVMRDAIAAGRRLRAIFKEPTITPSATQVKEFGLSKPLSSPNGAMRRGWGGITISRDTIHIPGVQLGYKRQVLFERHAVGGEYQAGWKPVGKGRLLTTFFPDDPSQQPFIVDSRTLHDTNNVAVTYHNPLDNVADLAHHFFKRCLSHHVVPYVVTKKTVFKWQEGFWQIHLDVFNRHYKPAFLAAGLLDKTGGELQHLISDAASMQLLRWRDGGFGMSAHNYDGDMLTDELSQVHRSPGFITSNLMGRTPTGEEIREFEASHGTVSDMWQAHQRGEQTSFNPLGMATALIGSMRFSGEIAGGEHGVRMGKLTNVLEKAMYNTFAYGQGTRDVAGPEGFTTEDFVAKVAWRFTRYLSRGDLDDPL